MKAERAGLGGLAVVLSILAGVLIVVNVYKVSADMPLLMADAPSGFGIGEGAAGILMAVIDYIGVLLALPAGIIVMRINAQRTVIIALACGIIGALVGALTMSYWVMLVSRLIEGIAYVLVSVAAPALILAWVKPEKRGLPMAIWSCYMGIGMFIVFTSAQMFSNWQALWWACAFALAAILLLVLLFCRLPKQGYDDGEDDGEASAAEGFKSLPTWMLGLSCVFFCFCAASVAAFCPTYCVRVLGLESDAANMLASLFTIGTIIGALIMGVLFNKVTALKQRIVVFVVSMAIALAVSFLYFNYSESMAIPVLLISGIVLQMAPATAFTLVADTVSKPALIGIASAILAMTMGFGGVLTTATGFIIELSGWGALTAVCVVSGAIGLALAFVFRITMKSRVPGAASDGGADTP
ncbi:MAG: MFS transporter [Coriobacteriales bacterium]|jgi:predicted MFS family arabinose efflux permease|nr:MFS transporter [Coriobacteriales bacterium]